MSNENLSFNDLFDTLKLKKTKSVEQCEDNVHCKECNNRLVLKEGSTVCTTCGLINDSIIDFNAEWRFYGKEDSKGNDPTRVGMPTNYLLPESSLGSTVAFKYNESYEMMRIRTYNNWNAMPYKERSLYNVFDKIQAHALNNGIPMCIIEEAKNLYKKISEVRIHRGSNRSGIIAACIYYACIIHKCPRSTKEIAEIFKLNITSMTKGCKKFDEIIHMNICNNETKTTSNTKSSDFVQRFSSKLNIGTNICDICIYICEKAEEFNIVSQCIPPSIAAGSIYLICTLLNINISKKEISQICKISEVTISKCYKKLFKYHNHILPDEVLNKLYPK